MALILLAFISRLNIEKTLSMGFLSLLNNKQHYTRLNVQNSYSQPKTEAAIGCNARPKKAGFNSVLLQICFQHSLNEAHQHPHRHWARAKSAQNHPKGCVNVRISPHQPLSEADAQKRPASERRRIGSQKGV